MLEEPVLLEDSRWGLRWRERVAGLGAAGQDGGLGKVRQGQGIHGRLLGAERRRDRGVQLWAPHDGHERQRRRPQLLRVVLHGHPTAAEARLPVEWLRRGYGRRRGGCDRRGPGGQRGELGSVVAAWLGTSLRGAEDADSLKSKTCVIMSSVGVFPAKIGRPLV